jgi:hypothetical protein
MSQINIAGDTSGSIAVVAPLVAGSNTITLPASTGTVLTSVSPASDLPSSIKGPAFSAYCSSTQSISNATNTKIQFQTEEFDTNSNYDNTTNYRFTPTVAGYYQISGAISYQSAVSGICLVSIYKNGSEIKRLPQLNASLYGLSGSALVYCNGSTDYIEMYCYQGSGGSVNTTTGNYGTYFQASMVRGA